MKRKILLCGATHGSNFGDSIFAYIFKDYITKYHNLDVYFTNVSEFSKKYLNIKKASISDLFSSEALIFISGGYFGDPQVKSLKGYIYHMILYYMYGIFMALRKKPIAIIGVGAGPLNCFLLRKIVKYIFKNSQLIILRDDESKNYMESYGCTKNIIVTTDSAQIFADQSYLSNIMIKPNILEQENLKNKKLVLIHITEAPGNELFEKKIIPALRETLFGDENIAFILTNDTIFNVDLEHIRLKYFPVQKTFIYNYSNPFEFLGLIKSVDSIITPKLHVGIFGSTFGKPVISFPVHPDKTIRYFKQIGYETHCKSIYDVTMEEAIQMIKKYLWKNIILSPDIIEKSKSNFIMLGNFLENLK